MAKHIGLPEGLVSLILNSHSETWALTSSGANPFLFELASGVQQGCPLAGVLFVLSFDPCVRWLSQTLEGIGVPLACADDVLVILKQVRAMSFVQHIFDNLKTATGLMLSPTKCIGVPLWGACSPHVIELLRSDLRLYAPFFRRVPDCGKYGLPRGPYWPRGDRS